MGSLAFIDARVEVNGVDMSDWIRQVTLPIEFEELEDTAMGDRGRSRIAGLQDSSLSLELNQDFAVAAVDALLFALAGETTVVKVRPTSAAISTTNPEYVATYLVSQYQPFGNSVGELATTSVQWPLSDPAGVQRNVA